MGNRYIRSKVYFLHELPEKIQAEFIGEVGKLSAEQSLYFENPTYKGEFLPLYNFMRINSKIWDGIYGTSYFSAYFVKFSNDNEKVVIADKWW